MNKNPTNTRSLPPTKPPACVADDGRVRIGAGIGKQAKGQA